MKLISTIACALLLSLAAQGQAATNCAAVERIVPSSEITISSEAVNERQLADEITRRLRRMGFNMIRNRLARPAEMGGVLC